MTTPETGLAEFDDRDLPPVQEDPHEEFSLLRLASEKDLKEALARMDAALSYIDQVRTFVLNRTKPNDWTDQSGNPYFGESGCNRFMAPFQIFEKDIKSWTIDDQGIMRPFSDPRAFEGVIKIIMFRGTIGSKVLGVEASFEGGSKLDDGFRSKDDVLFYSMKAKANWRGRGFRKILGMENLTWEDLKTAGIARESIKKIDRQTTAKADTKDATELWNMLLELNEGDPNKAEDYLFKMTDQPPKFPGKRRPAHLSEKQIAWILPKVRDIYHKQFPGKGGAAPVAANAVGVVHDSGSFRASVENLQNLVSKESYLAVLKEFGVTEAVEVSAAKRNAFLAALAAKQTLAIG